MEELRKVFYKTMAEMMDENPQVVYLDADLAGAMGTAGLFQEFPQQAFDVQTRPFYQAATTRRI